MADGGSPRVYHPDPCIAVYDAESTKGRELAPGARRGQRVRCRGPVRPLSGICERCGAKRLQPQPGPQAEFLACPAKVVLYGGAAYSGKSLALLLDALRYALVTPGWVGLILRRHATDYSDASSIFEKAKKLYSGIEGIRFRSSNQHRDIRFPSGATLVFRHLDDVNLESYQGTEYAWIGVDEATHFESEWLLYLITRMRTECGSNPSMRMTCNPDPDHALAEWVKPYLLLDPNHPHYGWADRSKSGTIRYWAVAPDDRIVWGETADECATAAERPVAEVNSFAFIAGSLEDNPLGLAANPNYAASLATSGRVVEQRLRYGNWLIREDVRGMLRYATRWGGIHDQPFAQIVKRRRGWDKAATRPTKGDPDPDFTAGVLLEWDVDGRVYVSGLALCRDDSPEVDKLMAATASQDGPRVLQAIRQDPAQAGKVDLLHTSAVLRSSGRCGPIAVMKEIGDKPTKAKPLALAIELGLAGHDPRADGSPAPMIYILNRNNWTEQPYKDPSTPETTLLAMFEAQVIPFFNPSKSKKKDIVDAMATAYSAPDVPMPDEDTDVANAWAAYG